MFELGSLEWIEVSGLDGMWAVCDGSLGVKNPEQVLMKFNFDLTKHLEVIVIGIIVVTTFPVLLKLFFGKRKQYPEDPSQKL